MKKKRLKKAMSTLISTLLIIALVLVSVGILWVVVKNVILSQSELTDLQKNFFSEDVGINSIRVNEPLVSFSLKRVGSDMGINQRKIETEVTGVVETDIISVVDLSGSMVSCNGVTSACCTSLGGFRISVICYGVNTNKQSECGAGICNGGIWIDRLTSTKEANKALVEEVLSKSEESRIGLVTYGTGIVKSIGLTNNKTLLDSEIDSWQAISQQALASTCICCGINNASDILNYTSLVQKQKRIIVMSDGETNIECPPRTGNYAVYDAIQSSCDARTLLGLDYLKVHSIGAGEGITAVANQTLFNISEVCGGGKYYNVTNVNDLVEIYEGIAVEIITTYSSTNNFNYLLIKFYNATRSYEERVTNVPEVFVLQTYNFNLTDKLKGEIIRIEIYPVTLSSSNKEVIGPMFDYWAV